MSKKKTMWIAMANGGLLAAAAMGLPKDKAVDPHAPVEVPEEYGLHLIHDKFAYKAEPPEEPKTEKPARQSGGEKAGKAQKPADPEKPPLAAGKPEGVQAGAPGADDGNQGAGDAGATGQADPAAAGAGQA